MYISAHHTAEYRSYQQNEVTCNEDFDQLETRKQIIILEKDLLNHQNNNTKQLCNQIETGQFQVF